MEMDNLLRDPRKIPLGMFVVLGLPTIAFAWFLISNLPGWGVVPPVAPRTELPINHNARAPFNTVPLQAPVASTRVVTKAKYDGVREGMTYDQVRALLSAPGEESLRTYIGGHTSVSYTWTNSNLSGMNAAFRDDRLVGKGQFGLP
jgi:hypothetical protein